MKSGTPTVNQYAPCHHSIRITAVPNRMHTKGGERKRSARNDIRCTITAFYSRVAVQLLWFPMCITMSCGYCYCFCWCCRCRCRCQLFRIGRVSFCLTLQVNLNSMLELWNSRGHCSINSTIKGFTFSLHTMHKLLKSKFIKNTLTVGNGLALIRNRSNTNGIE